MTDRSGLSTLAVVLLALIGCEPSGSSKVPGGGDGSGGGRAGACEGDQAKRAFEAFRQQGFESSAALDSARAELRSSCEAGCATNCIEYAHTSAEASEARQFYARACEAGEASVCPLALQPELDGARQLCEAGKLLGCAAMIALDGVEGEDPQGWKTMADISAGACDINEGRACSVHAWVRCAVQGHCDDQAVEYASKAARLLPNPEVVETLALVQCRAGQAAAANQVLASSCTAGNTDACARSCETVRGQALLVREAERQRTQQTMLLMALNQDTTTPWYTVLSAMDTEQLTRFEDMLGKFLPPVTEVGAQAKVPAELREQTPELVEAILRSPQLDAKKISYWFKRLPNMSEAERINLFDSLRKQWWIIPGDVNVTPQAFIEGVRLRSGGLSPAWLAD